MAWEGLAVNRFFLGIFYRPVFVPPIIWSITHLINVDPSCCETLLFRSLKQNLIIHPFILSVAFLLSVIFGKKLHDESEKQICIPLKLFPYISPREQWKEGSISLDRLWKESIYPITHFHLVLIGSRRIGNYRLRKKFSELYAGKVGEKNLKSMTIFFTKNGLQICMVCSRNFCGKM